MVLTVDQRDLDVDDREAGTRPLPKDSAMPFSTAGMNSLGIEPPLIWLTKS